MGKYASLRNLESNNIQGAILYRKKTEVNCTRLARIRAAQDAGFFRRPAIILVSPTLECLLHKIHGGMQLGVWVLLRRHLGNRLYLPKSEPAFLQLLLEFGFPARILWLLRAHPRTKPAGQTEADTTVGQQCSE